MRLTRSRVVLLIAAIVLAILWGRVTEFAAVDKCLDSGSRYDYTIGRCDVYEKPPYPAPREPPAVRAHSEFASVVVAAALLAAFAVQDWRQKRDLVSNDR